jgi:2,3-bisphosphoglycerate-independent phosphoglycerate mutase
MKSVILRIEDVSRPGGQTASLLDGARAAFLQHLLQAGAGGTIQRRGGSGVIDRFRVHRGLLGVKPDDAEVSAGQCYADGANVRLAEGETAWCCELVTQHDGIVIDPTAGNIPTKESRVLIMALNAQLGSDTRRWEVGDSFRHILVVRDPSLGGDGLPQVHPPELLVGRSWRRDLARGARHAALRQLIEQAEQLLEAHAVNRVRVDLGENPANLMWLWGAGHPRPAGAVSEQAARSGVVISNSFPLRGLAQRLGLEWVAGPPSLEEEPLQRLAQAMTGRLRTAERVYAHVEVRSNDPVERQCVMERIDQLLLAPLHETLMQGEPWRLVAVIDDRSGNIPFIALGTGLPQQPIARLTAEALAGSPLHFRESAQLLKWLTQA